MLGFILVTVCNYFICVLALYFNHPDLLCSVSWSLSFYYVYIYCDHFRSPIPVILVSTTLFYIIVSNDRIVVEVNLGHYNVVILVIVMLSCNSKSWSLYYCLVSVIPVILMSTCIIITVLPMLTLVANSEWYFTSVHYYCCIPNRNALYSSPVVILVSYYRLILIGRRSR